MIDCLEIVKKCRDLKMAKEKLNLKMKRESNVSNSISNLDAFQSTILSLTIGKSTES